MAKKWYPVIDYEKCEECGSCVKKCTHGVYDKQKAPTPVVVFPEGCLQDCHGCGNICPAGAIVYIGENTDWTPPNGKKSDIEAECCCSSNNDCCKE